MVRFTRQIFNATTAQLEVDLVGEAAFARATISEYLDSIRTFEFQSPDGRGG